MIDSPIWLNERVFVRPPEVASCWLHPEASRCGAADFHFPVCRLRGGAEVTALMESADAANVKLRQLFAACGEERR